MVGTWGAVSDVAMEVVWETEWGSRGDTRDWEWALQWDPPPRRKDRSDS